MKAQLMRHRVLTASALATASLVVVSCGGSAPGGSEQSGSDEAADPAEFFAGETIRLIVPYDPGGGFDSFARLLGPELEEELGNGTSVDVVNRPGGGSLQGSNEVYQSESDGLTLGLINYPGTVFAELSETEGVQFDNAEWTFMARLGAINPIVYTSGQSGYEDFEAMMAADDSITFGIGGAGSDAHYATVLISDVLGFPTEIIAGYPGGAEADAALMVGEVEAGVNSVDAALTRIENEDVNINTIISTEPNDLVPDVPPITEFGDEKQQQTLVTLASIYDLERVLVGPPGIDEERADFLADAIYNAASSSGYQEAMEEAQLTPSPLSRDETIELSDTVVESIDELAPQIAEATVD